MTRYYPHGGSSSSHCPVHHSPDCLECTHELQTIRVAGPAKLMRGHDADFHVHPSVRTYSNGEAKPQEGYFTTMVPHEGHDLSCDLCGYCGNCNTHSNPRMGWDCGYCGGN